MSGAGDRPLVSVVTPYYNSADTLDACIRAVTAQAYPSFEYILADNRSTDGGDEIGRKAAEADERIRYVRFEEFLAQLPNFNRALELVSPEAAYVKVALADDLLLEGCLTKMVDLAERHPSVGIVSSYRLDGSRVKGSGLELEEELVPGGDAARWQLRGAPFLVGSPNTVLYRAEAVRERSPFFRPESYHADTEADYEILRSWDLGFVHQLLSYTRVQSESIRGGVSSYNPHLLGRVLMFHRYGREFLSSEEAGRLWKDLSRRYWRFLARSTIAFRGRDFWRYHREGLESGGLTLSRGSVMAQLLPALAELLARPSDSARSVARLWSRVGS